MAPQPMIDSLDRTATGLEEALAPAGSVPVAVALSAADLASLRQLASSPAWTADLRGIPIYVDGQLEDGTFAVRYADDSWELRGFDQQPPARSLCRVCGRAFGVHKAGCPKRPAADPVCGWCGSAGWTHEHVSGCPEGER